MNKIAATTIAISLALSAFAPHATAVSDEKDGNTDAVRASNVNKEGPTAVIGNLPRGSTIASGKPVIAMDFNPQRLPKHLQERSELQVLLPAIAAWLVANFQLTATDYYPLVKFVPPANMYALRFGAQGPDQSQDAAVEFSRLASRNTATETEALYNNASWTIYLREGWTGATPAETSVLVHEMVHHLQNVAALKYECPQAREALAYQAQAQWLAQYGRNIKREFGLNPMALLVRTKCLF